MEIVRVDHHSDNPIRDLIGGVFPQGRAAELNKFVRDRVSPLRYNVKGVSAVNLNH